MRIGVVIRTLLPPFLLATIPLAIVGNIGMALATGIELSNHKLVFKTAEYTVLAAMIGFVLAVMWRGDRYLGAIGDRRSVTCAIAGALSLLAWYLVGLPLLLLGVIRNRDLFATVFMSFELVAAFLVTLLVLHTAARPRATSST